MNSKVPLRVGVGGPAIFYQLVTAQQKYECKRQLCLTEQENIQAGHQGILYNIL